MVQINSWPGFSGSPLFDIRTKEIVGVFSQGGTLETGYANRADYVHFCFGSDGRWNFQLPSCLAGWKQSWQETFKAPFMDLPSISQPSTESDRTKTLTVAGSATESTTYMTQVPPRPSGEGSISSAEALRSCREISLLVLFGTFCYFV
jgi:hypothetical protein